jgi:hypothetical protein
MLRMARKSGHYPLLSRGDINLYSLFVERAHALVKPGGMVGLLTPSGIASDLSASEFFRKVATGGHLKALYDFENKKVFFPDVHASFKFCIMVASPTRKFDAATCAFYLHNIAELKNPDQAFPITASDFARVNPNTGTAPIFRTRRDMALTTAIYERWPVMVDKSGEEPKTAWPLRYLRAFDSGTDEHKFHNISEMGSELGAWKTAPTVWTNGTKTFHALYEGKMVQAFDHRAASVVFNPANLIRKFQTKETTIEERAAPEFVSLPSRYVDISGLALPEWMPAFKDVTASTNVRTMISAIIPRAGANDTLPLLLWTGNSKDAWMRALIVADFNSMIFDFVARQKTQTNHLRLYSFEQLPVIPPADYARPFGPKTAADIVKVAVLELTYTAHDMAPFARDMGHVDATGDVLPPFIWDEERRLHLRAKLDALYFILYGVFDPADPAQSRDDIRYIYSTFPIVERQETAAHGSYRSRDLCLAYINTLIAGQPDAIVAG